jgi:hypothetical protein
MTCPETVCTVTPRPALLAIPLPLAPQLGTNPLTETTTKITSCNGCELVPTLPVLPVRQPTRTITMGQDPCVTPQPPPTQVFESTKTVTLSQAYIKNNCETSVGSTVTYSTSAEATAYSTSNQADADAKANQAAQDIAQQDIMSNGQAYANATGACA